MVDLTKSAVHAVHWKNLKRLTLATADLHEESYDSKNRRYRLDLREASSLACKLLEYDDEFAKLVALALSGYWNDVLEWAGDGKGRVPIVSIPKDFVYPSHDPIKPEGN